MKILTLTQFNEGAGAGYELEFADIKIDKKSITVLDHIFDFGDGLCYLATADVMPCELDSWKAIGYEYGIDSNYDNDMPMHVDGGKIYMYVHREEVCWHLRDEGDEREFDEITDDECKAAIPTYFDECDDSVTISAMYGAGWAHSNLGTPTVIGMDPKAVMEISGNILNKQRSWHFYDNIIGELECANSNGIFRIISAEIDMPDIANEINSYFADPEIYDDPDY